MFLFRHDRPELSSWCPIRLPIPVELKRKRQTAGPCLAVSARKGLTAGLMAPIPLMDSQEFWSSNGCLCFLGVMVLIDRYQLIEKPQYLSVCKNKYLIL
jgi:hypothetical protein